MKTLKVGAIALMCITLCSCATLHMVSIGISTLSYSITGKSVTDHVISQVTSQDCALHRLILGQQACFDNQQDYIAVLNSPDSAGLKAEAKWRLSEANSTNNQHLDTHKIDKPANLSLQQHQHRPITLEEITSFTAMDFSDELLESLDDSVADSHNESFYARLIPAEEIPRLYAVVGTFKQLRYAQTRQAEYRQHQAQLLTKGSRYQVVIGPLTAQQYTEFAALEHKDSPWRTRLCHNLTPAPCDSTMLASR
ncbi:hypothetical protein PULV_a1708 [Pseudoalteromonas ulvae UL12]|uniref:SPOR domain-containing protein n=1 Tax=Pseudoalteromonas ulvae TaxID=107327 RepID=A0A244CN22_PSEDV|nr:hypothetical protein [Pseudoalteromonas ulvae]MBE0364139.1 hypothetical protein [Pseudoalteromonas ulvae UL12]OUL56906.1 hypothetical protein B1199_16195 [Pseudoalteromonas ulvae]